MIKSIQLFAVVLLLLAAGATSGGHHHGCPDVPSMTAKKACSTVCGTRHTHQLCLRTLLPRRSRHAASPVTHYAAVAARSALDAYDATEAAARQATLYVRGPAALPRDERVAYAGCLAGYKTARQSMSRLAGDLARMASSSSCHGAANLRRDYKGGLRGMDACRRSLFGYGYTASPLSGRNLADRNATFLAALLCSLVPTPPEKRRGVEV
uniref:Uncharacterized protein n=1 Tax=Avena sativa TaxID=4498 RepID=A0ACD5ZY02_AVESA